MSARGGIYEGPGGRLFYGDGREVNPCPVRSTSNIVTIPRLDYVRSLINRVSYKNWTVKSDFMGNGLYVQPILDVKDDQGEPWRGRKWYVSNYATDAEIVNTIFKSILTAEEHETREQCLFDGLAIYGPHQSLEAMKENAQETIRRS